MKKVTKAVIPAAGLGNKSATSNKGSTKRDACNS